LTLDVGLFGSLIPDFVFDNELVENGFKKADKEFNGIMKRIFKLNKTFIDK
jgi:hypothetical protein